MNGTRPTPEQNWIDFWEPLLTNKDGSVNMAAVKNELSDWHYCMGEYAKVYMHISGGLLSKPNYPAEIMIQHADDHYASLDWDSHEALFDIIRPMIKERDLKTFDELRRA